MPERTIHLDACILGGGIAGLWTLARLRHEGYAAALLESGALAQGQTIWSQGIIHGGVKYALTGEASAAARAIAEMPRVWSDCLAGRGCGDGAGVDLSAVAPLADHQHLWTTPGLLSRLTGLAAGAVIRTPLQRLPRGDWPAAFAPAPRGVDLYRVAEPVLPIRAVVAALAQGHRDALARIHRVEAIESAADHALARVALASGERVAVRARLLVCAAGAGNEHLAALAGMRDAAPMQRRPLHMVFVRGERDRLPAIFGHCLGAGATPRLTVTSADAEPERAGHAAPSRVWTVGGALAEDGVAREPAEQIVTAKRELAACLPWIDFASPGLSWAAGRIDRAEGRVEGNARPDAPVIARRGRVAFAWPTKLALAPRLATDLAGIMREMGPRAAGAGEARVAPLPGDVRALGGPPEVADPPWTAAAWS